MNEFKYGLLFKIQTDPLVGETPTLSDLVYSSKPQVKLKVDKKKVNRMRTGYGGEQQLRIGKTVTVDFEVQIPVDWAAATDVAPSIGKILRACGFTETTTTGVSIGYANHSAGLTGEAASIIVPFDGQRRLIHCAVGNVKGAWKAGEIITIALSFEGLYTSNYVTDVAFPITTPSVDNDLLMTYSNAAVKIGAYEDAVIENVNWDLGNEIAMEANVNASNTLGIERVYIKNCAPKADCDPLVDALSVFNPFSKMLSDDRITLETTVTKSGKTMKLTIGNLSIDDVSDGARENQGSYAIQLVTDIEADVDFLFT